jgi:Subtilase family
MESQILAGALPTTHPAMVIVRLRNGASPGRGITETELTGGLALLDELDRAGRVHAVLSLSPVPDEPSTSRGAIAALSTTQETDATATRIIHLSEDNEATRLLAAMEDDPNVEFVSRVPTRWLASTTPPPVLAHRIADMESRIGQLESRFLHASLTASLWNLQKISIDQVEELKIDEGWNIRVGVLDTGVDDQHPDLAGRLDHYIHEGSSVTGNVSDQDVVGHGTHVSGTIAARLNEAIGTRGICTPRLSVWKIFDDTPDYIEGKGIYWYLVDPVLYRRALADCAENVDVINLSIGGTEPPDPQESTLFRVLSNRGVVIVAAMGNERALDSPTSYPAAIPGVIAVGATTPDDDVAVFSNTGNHISLSAPGVAIWSTVPCYPGQVGFHAETTADGKPQPGSPLPRPLNYAALSGTSMAAPHVTSAAALVKANSDRSVDPESIRYLLMASADHLSSMHGQIWTSDVGAGRLNLRRLLFACRNL